MKVQESSTDSTTKASDLAGQVNPEANTVAFTVSWRNHFTNLLAVSAYSGHLQYLATGDKVFRSTYILTRKGGRTEIGSDVFYPVETSPPIACPRAEGKYERKHLTEQ